MIWDSGFCGIVESLVDLSLKRERGLYFWQKPKVAKAFAHLVRDSGILCFVCEILRFTESMRRILRFEILGFCGIMESLVN